MNKIWEGLLARLGLKRAKRRRTYTFNESLDTELVELAEQEQRPEGEYVEDLVATAIAQQRTSRVLKDCWQSLTPREQEMTALTCRGYTNRQMAGRLGVSEETVKTHVKNALRKFKMRGKSVLRMALEEWDFSEWDK
jgi:RNA polymerase sigma factor (sigma-70 family)